MSSHGSGNFPQKLKSSNASNYYVNGKTQDQAAFMMRSETLRNHPTSFTVKVSTRTRCGRKIRHPVIGGGTMDSAADVCPGKQASIGRWAWFMNGSIRRHLISSA